MSVAFRRESDDEHKEPRFELPLPSGPNLVTRRGLALIQGSAERIERALAQAGSDAERAALARDLRYWRTRAATAELAPPPDPDVICIGSRARIRLAGAERLIEIVGHDEAEPAADRIAFAAPLARALIGGATGDRIDFNGAHDAIEILAVDAADGR